MRVRPSVHAAAHCPFPVVGAPSCQRRLASSLRDCSAHGTLRASRGCVLSLRTTSHDRDSGGPVAEERPLPLCPADALRCATKLLRHARTVVCGLAARCRLSPLRRAMHALFRALDVALELVRCCRAHPVMHRRLESSQMRSDGHAAQGAQGVEAAMCLRLASKVGLAHALDEGGVVRSRNAGDRHARKRLARPRWPHSHAPSTRT